MKRLLLLLLCLCSLAHGYIPPKGIPDPADSFSTFGEIDQAAPTWPTEWTQGSPTFKVGYYYVDKTAVGATNTSNTYGYPGHARLTPPEGNLTGAHRIHIEAGNYTNVDSLGDRFDFSGTFTNAAPLWITGNPTTHPVFADAVQLGYVGGGSYIVFSDFRIYNATAGVGLRVAPSADGFNIDHVLIRNCTLQGTGVTADPGGVSVGLSQTTDTIPNSNISYVVFYNSEVSNYGSATSDDCGFLNGYHTDHVWCLNNLIHNVGADSVAGSHYSNYTTKLTQNYFIGGNTLYGGGENAIDLKNVQGGVISENNCYGPFLRENGWLIVLHYGASSSFHCKDITVCFNNLHHASGGIYTTSGGCDRVQMIGNQIYDIHAAYSNNASGIAAEDGCCMVITGSDGTMRIADNTCYDYDRGITVAGLASGDLLKIHGNIFNSRSDGSKYEVDVTNGQQSFVSMDYNCWPPTASAFLWANASRTFSYMQATALQEAHGIAADPLFVSPGAQNFAIQTGSPCKNTSVEGPVGDTAYDAFAAYFGLTIEKDFLGGARPSGAAWDMGAFEFGATPTPGDPPELTSPLTASGQVGVAFSYQITASNNPTSYNATGLPSGLSVNTATGSITGTPAGSGATNVTISATNSFGSDSDTLVLTVTVNPVTYTLGPAARRR